MRKLTYKKTADVKLDIDLLNGYTVVATGLFNYDEQKYHITLYMKENTVNILDLMDDFADVVFETNQKYIGVTVLKYVSDNLVNGKFQYYINRYDEMIQKDFYKEND